MASLAMYTTIVAQLDVMKPRVVNVKEGGRSEKDAYASGTVKRSPMAEFKLKQPLRG